MTVAVTLRPSPQAFPVGTSVQVFAEALRNPDSRLSGKPAGSVLSEAIVADGGTLTVTGLVASEAYVGWAVVNGQDSYVRFSTAPAGGLSAPVSSVSGAVTSPVARPMLWGVVGAFHHASTWRAVNVLGDRGGTRAIEASYNTNPAIVSAAVGESLAAGLQPIVLVSALNETTVLSAVNAVAYGEGCAAIVSRCCQDHPTWWRLVELINEPYFRGPHQKSNAVDYAALCKSAYEHVVAAGWPLSGSEQVTLMVAAFGTYEEVNAEGVGTGVFSDVNGKGWIRDLAASASGAYLKEHVNAWCCHPYGKAEGSPPKEDDAGLSIVPDYRGRAIREGFNRTGCDTWYVTEFGWHVGAGGTPEVASETAQAEEWEKALPRLWKWYEEGWLKGAFGYLDEGFGGEVGWTLVGKKAGVALGAFASAHSSLPVVTGRKDSPRRRTLTAFIAGVPVAGKEYPLGRVYVPQDGYIQVVRASWRTSKGVLLAAEVLVGGVKVVLSPEPTVINESTKTGTAENPVRITADGWLTVKVAGNLEGEDLWVSVEVEHRDAAT